MNRDRKKKLVSLLIFVGIIASSIVFLFPFAEALQDDSDLEVTLHCRLDTSSSDMVSTLMPTGTYDFWEQPELDIGTFSHDRGSYTFDDCQLGTYNETGIMNITNQNTNFQANNTNLDEYDVSISNDATMELELNYTAGYNESFYNGVIDAESYSGDISSLETYDNDQLIIDDFEYAQDNEGVITSRTNIDHSYWYDCPASTTLYSQSYSYAPQNTAEGLNNYDKLFVRYQVSHGIPIGLYGQLQYKLELDDEIIADLNSGTEYSMRVYWKSSHGSWDEVSNAKIWYELLDGSSQQQYSSANPGTQDYTFTKDYIFMINSANLYQGNSIRIQFKSYTYIEFDPFTVWDSAPSVDMKIYLIQLQARKQASLELKSYQKTEKQEDNVLNAFLKINESLAHSDAPIELQMFNGTGYQTLATYSNTDYEYSQITLPSNLNYYSTFDFRLWIVCTPTNNHETQEFMCESLNLSTYYKGKGVFDLINVTEFKYSILAVEYAQNITLGLASNTILNDYWVKSIYTFSSADFDYYEYTSSLTILNQNVSYYFDLATNITVYIANFSTSYSSSESRVPSEIDLKLNNYDIIDQSLKGGFVVLDDFQDTLTITATEYIYFELNITIDFTFTFSLDVVSKTYLSKTFILETDHAIIIESIDLSDDLKIHKIYLNNIDRGSSNPCSLFPNVEMNSGNEFTLDIILSEEIYLPLQFLKNNLGSGTANIYLCGTANSVHYYNINGNLVYTISIPSGHDPFYADLIFSEIQYTPSYTPDYSNDLSGYSYGSPEYGNEDVSWGADYYQTSLNGSKIGESGGSGYEQILAEYFSALNGYMSHTYGDLDSQNMTYTVNDYLYMENLFPSNLTFEEWKNWVHNYNSIYMNSTFSVNDTVELTSELQPYHYPATYSFTGEVGETGTDIDFVDYCSIPNDCDISIASAYQEHSAVLEMSHDGNSDDPFLYNYFDSQTKGTIEFWWLTTDSTKAQLFQIREDGNIAIYLRIYNGYFTYSDTSSHNVLACTNNVWYHHKIEFSAYTDTYNWYINNSLVSMNCKLYEDKKSINYFNRFMARNWDNDVYSQYFDAFGISWDSDYQIGDNLFWTSYQGTHTFEDYNLTESGFYSGYDSFDYEMDSGYYFMSDSEDFNDEGDNDEGYEIGWIDDYSYTVNCNATIQTSALDNHKNTLKLTDNSNTERVIVYHDFAYIQSNAIIEFWLAKNDISDSILYLNFYESTTNIDFLLFYNNFLSYYDSGSYTPIKSSYITTNTFNHYKIEFDDSADTMDVYIDGVLEGNNLSLTNSITNGIDNIRLSTEITDSFAAYIDAFGVVSEHGYSENWNVNSYDIDELLDNDFEIESSILNGYMNIIDEDSHKNCLHLYDNQPNLPDTQLDITLFSKQFNENQVNGNIEFWFKTTDATRYTSWYLRSNTASKVYLRVHADNFEYYDGSWHTIMTCLDDIWYHLRIDFDCATDTYDFYINGTLKRSDSFVSTCDYISDMRFAGDSGGSGFHVYYDALDFSWRDNYDEGDNLNSYGEEVLERLGDEGWTINRLSYETGIGVLGEYNQHIKYVCILDNSSETSPALDYPFSAITSDQSIEFWFKTSDITKRTYIRIRGSLDDEAILLYFYDNKLQAYDGGISNYIDVCSIISDQWYHIKLIWDFSEQNFDIYVNSTLFNEDIDFKESTSYISLFQIYTFSSHYDYYSCIDSLTYSWEDDVNSSLTLNSEELLDVYADITQTYTNTLLNRYDSYSDYQDIYNITIEFEYMWTTLNSSYIEDAEFIANNNSIDLSLAGDWTYAELNFLFDSKGVKDYDTAMYNQAPIDICTDGVYFYVLDYQNPYVSKYNLDFEYIEYYDLYTLSGFESRMPYGMTWDGTYFYVADGDGSVYKYNSDFSSFIEKITPEEPAGADEVNLWSITWDGTYFYIIVYYYLPDGTVFHIICKYNSDFSSIIDSYDVGTLGGNDAPFGITWNGSNFYIVDSDSYLYKYPSDFSSLLESYDLGLGLMELRGVCIYDNYFYIADEDSGYVKRYPIDFSDLVDSFDTIFNVTNGELYVRNMNYTMFFEAVDILNYNRLYQSFRYDPTFSLEYLQQIRGCWILNFTYDFNATDDYPYYDFYNTIDHSLLRMEIHLNSEGGWNTPYILSYNSSQNNINVCFNITDYLEGLGQYIFSDFYIDIYIAGNPSEFKLDDLILYDFDSDFYLVDLLWITDSLVISHQNRTCYWRASDEYISHVEITELYASNINLLYNITLINNTLQYQTWNNVSGGFYELNFTFFDNYDNWEKWTLNFTIIESISLSIGYENPKFIDEVNTVEAHILTDYGITRIWYDNSSNYILFYDNSSYPCYSYELNFTTSYSIECSYNISVKVLGVYNDTFWVNVSNLCFIERTTLLDFNNLYSSYYQDEMFNVSFILRDTYNNPLQNEILNYTIEDPNGINIVNSSDITDSSGEVNYSFNFSLFYDVGFYHLNVSYSGTTQYNSVSKLQSFQLRPIERTSNSTEIGLKVNGYSVNNSQIRINGTNIFNITNNDYSIFDVEIQFALSYSASISYSSYLSYTYIFRASSMLSSLTYFSANLTGFPSNFTNYYFDGASSTNYNIAEGILSINDLIGEKFYHLYDFRLGLYYLDDTDIQRDQITDNPRTDVDSIEFKEYLTASRTFSYWYMLNSYDINSISLNHTRTNTITSYSSIINEGSKYYFKQDCLANDLFEATIDYDPEWDINFAVDTNGTFCSIEIQYKSSLIIENVTIAINLTDDNVYAENWTHSASQSLDNFVLEIPNINFTTSYQTITVEGISETPYCSFSSFVNEESFTISENDYDEIDEYYHGYLSYPYYSQSFIARNINSSWTLDGIHYQSSSYDITSVGYFECSGWGTGITGSYLRFKANPITKVERYMKDDEGATKEVVYRIDSSLPASDVDIEIYIEEDEYVTIEGISYEGDEVEDEDIESFRLVRFKDRTYYQIKGVDLEEGTNKVKITYRTENVFNYGWLFLPIGGGLILLGFTYWKIKNKKEEEDMKKKGLKLRIESSLKRVLRMLLQPFRKDPLKVKEDKNDLNWSDIKEEGKELRLKKRAKKELKKIKKRQNKRQN